MRSTAGRTGVALMAGGGNPDALGTGLAARPVPRHTNQETGMQPRQHDQHDEDQLCGAGAERGFAGGGAYAGAPGLPAGGSDGSRHTSADERGVYGQDDPAYLSPFGGRVDSLPMRSGRPDQGFGG